MSIKGLFVAVSDSFTKSSSYVNNKGEHPKHAAVICANSLVFEKDQLNDDNWLYVGDEKQEQKESQLHAMRFHDCIIPIID